MLIKRIVLSRVLGASNIVHVLRGEGGYGVPTACAAMQSTADGGRLCGAITVFGILIFRAYTDYSKLGIRTLRGLLKKTTLKQTGIRDFYDYYYNLTLSRERPNSRSRTISKSIV